MTKKELEIWNHNREAYISSGVVLFCRCEDILHLSKLVKKELAKDYLLKW